MESATNSDLQQSDFYVKDAIEYINNMDNAKLTIELNEIDDKNEAEQQMRITRSRKTRNSKRTLVDDSNKENQKSKTNTKERIKRAKREPLALIENKQTQEEEVQTQTEYEVAEFLANIRAKVSKETQITDENNNNSNLIDLNATLSNQDSATNTSYTTAVSECVLEKKHTPYVLYSNKSSSLEHLENNRIEISLHMTCESDTSIDVNNQNTDNKFMYSTRSGTLNTPKLEDFRTNIFQAYSFDHFIKTNLLDQIILNTPIENNHNNLDNQATLISNNYRSDLVYDDLGLTVVREREPPPPVKLEEKSDTTYQQPDVDSKDAPVDQQDEEDKESVEQDEEKEILVAVEASSSRKKTNLRQNKDSEESSPEEKELNYALKAAKVIFSAQELKTGIFVMQNSKNRSKVREPLDHVKTQKLIKSIGKKFNYSDEKMKDVWNFLRIELNKKIYKSKK